MMVPVIVLLLVVMMMMMPMLRSWFRCHGTESNLPRPVAHRFQSNEVSVLFETPDDLIYHSAGIPPILSELHMHTESHYSVLFDTCLTVFFLQGTWIERNYEINSLNNPHNTSLKRAEKTVDQIPTTSSTFKANRTRVMRWSVQSADKTALQYINTFCSLLMFQ